MTSQGQTCVNTPILDTLRLPRHLSPIPGQRSSRTAAPATGHRAAGSFPCRRTGRPGPSARDTHLAFASPGRLRGHIADDRDLFDMFEFQRDATNLLGAEITVYSDGALRNDHVSPDLTAATLL